MQKIYQKWIFISILISTLICVCLARFFAKQQNISNDQWDGWDNIVFALDVSKSMNAVDVNIASKSYSRLQAAKILINNIVNKTENKKFGLVVFAEDATSVSPLTADYSSFLNLLAGVNHQNVVKQGTNIYNALALAIPRFLQNEDKKNYLIILSDGWEDETIKYKKEIKELLEDQDIKIFVIGIWMEAWSYIPEWRSIRGELVYKTFENELVITKINTNFLKNISSLLWWKFILFENAFQEVIKTLSGDISFKNKKTHSEKTSQIFMLLALFFFSIFITLILWKKFT